jgi:hypothetical protein
MPSSLQTASYRTLVLQTGWQGAIRAMARQMQSFLLQKLRNDATSLVTLSNTAQQRRNIQKHKCEKFDQNSPFPSSNASSLYGPCP